MSWLRRAQVTAVLAIVVACSDADKAPDPPAVYLPSRVRDAGKDPVNVLDATTVDTGPPPDPFCAEPGLVLCFTFDGGVENLVGTAPKIGPSKVVDVSLVMGKKNQAARFDTGSVVTFDYAPLLEMNAASVEAWINRDLTTFGEDTVFDDDQRFTMTVEADGTLRCKTPTGVARGGTAPIEQWVHVACVFDGTNMTAYVNGAAVASAAGTIGTSSTASAALGDGAPNGGEGFAGEIDSFRVWNVARTAAQISAAALN